jgi:hypothetical protein
MALGVRVLRKWLRAKMVEADASRISKFLGPPAGCKLVDLIHCSESQEALKFKGSPLVEVGEWEAVVVSTPETMKASAGPWFVPHRSTLTQLS